MYFTLIEDVVVVVLILINRPEVCRMIGLHVNSCQTSQQCNRSLNAEAGWVEKGRAGMEMKYFHFVKNYINILLTSQICYSV